jgi:GT2 family glycosyltransferase
MTACDIIIPVWDHLDFTRDCINSILKNTAPGYRLIIIDNGSAAGTKNYLKGLKATGKPEVVLIRNEENLGFVKAANQGIAASSAPFLCILNNDTIVTEGWLEEMMDVANGARDIGIVNPASNNLGQKPAKGESIESYGHGLKKEAGKFVELGAAVGFCMLIKREVIEKTGPFDEIYGMGNFEDTDFSRRAVKAGYRCVRACGAYVYHRESSSFGKIKTFEEDFRRNRQIFEFRWGRPKRIAYMVDPADENAIKKLNAESLKLARSGNWVTYLSKGSLEIPRHSNISAVTLSPERFYLKAVWSILKKKKRYDEVLVGEERIGNILERLSFIHKAKIGYY